MRHILWALLPKWKVRRPTYTVPRAVHREEWASAFEIPNGFVFKRYRTF